MVALIDNDLPVLCDEVFDSLFVVGALDDGDVHTAAALALSSPNLPD